jgi:dihydrofolate synthase/folylpolyglutamate synthase
MEMYRARRSTLLDGAHNPEGARTLRDFLAGAGFRNTQLVFAALRDKDVALMARTLFPFADDVHIAGLDNARAMTPDEISARVPRFRSRLHLHRSAPRALRAAWECCPPEGLVVVTGSLYLIGEIIDIVRADAGLSRSLFRAKARRG